MRQTTGWAALEWIAGIFVVSCVAAAGPDVSLRSPLAAGIIVLAGSLGRIVALIVGAVGT